MNGREFPTGIREIPTDVIRAHLQRVLDSSAFRFSKRCRRFLEYVVGEVLEGRGASLKERTLAAEVFDRPKSFDAEDTIVRVGAREVRKRLAQYYASAEGINEPLRIELHSGSYAPEFVYAPSSITRVLEEAPAEQPSRKPEPRRPGYVWGLALAAVIAVVAISLPFAVGRHEASLFDEFWTPLWYSPQPVLVVIANPLVYHPSTRAERLNDQRLGPSSVPIQRPLQLPARELDGSDMIPVPDQYVGYGDSVASTNIASLLASHSVRTRLRPSIKTDFADFRETPAVLIGAFTNRWTLEFTQKLRFYFGYDAQRAPAILDATNTSQHWSIPEKEDNGRSSEDYFLICRLTHSASGKFTVIVAGLTQFGTEAAARFMVDPGRLEETLKNIGNGWQHRNVQILFHAKVIGNAPSASELVAWNLS